MTDDFSSLIHENADFSLKQKLQMVGRLSLPGILAQISEIVMEYIDAAMVGVLGASASAAIGLVSSTTWLFGGALMAVSAGFSVQVAHAIGARQEYKAKCIFKQSLLFSFLFSLLLSFLGIVLAQILPQWLQADESLWQSAKDYFLFFAVFIPVRQINSLCMNMLQCSGNMKVPSIVATGMCLMDVVFNYFLIFPTRTITLFGFSLTVYGANLQVKGAQLGTSLAIALSMVILLLYALLKEKKLKICGVKNNWIVEKPIIKTAFHIGGPMALEQCATMAAQVVSTRIVAPLGTIAIAANSFAVTAESICYMPGYGIGSAATTMVGQAVGAQRKDLANSFAWLTTITGMTMMTLTGIIMYFMCPYVFAFLTPVKEIQQLGTTVLRIELLAEPMFAASIVANGAMRGAGDTLIPGLLNLLSIWGVRISLAWFLSKTMGLNGVWIAMAIELCIRGGLFLIRLKRKTWLWQK